MAIALTQGHVQRAIDFYKKSGKYFIIGGTTPWTDSDGTADDTAIPSPNVEDFKLRDVIGLKKVDSLQMVVPDSNGTLQFNSNSWRIVNPTPYSVTITASATIGATVLTLSSLAHTNVGNKVRIANTDEATVTAVNYENNQITINTPITVNLTAGSILEGGPVIEDAKYVYVQCTLVESEFPTNVSFRQVGLCTEVVPQDGVDDDILLAASSTHPTNDFKSLGVLEILDNRAPATRTSNSSESLALIIEF